MVKDTVRQLGKNGIYVITVPKPATLWAESLARLGISKTGWLVGVHSHSNDLRQIKEWIENRSIRPHLKKKYSAKQAADAHRHIESKHTVGKICIEFDNIK
jgi:NADPH:quinone reductase-like Zn-dependent oxidoreductase